MYSQDRRPRKLAWPLQAMPLARASSLIYALLILYISLNPFDFDFQNGISVWAWIYAPLPRFITPFDVLVNVLAYIPFGFLLVFAAFPRWRNFLAIGIAVSLSAALALGIETLQSWVPSRVPSLMDWWANVFGGLLGGLLAIPLGPQWLSGSAIRRRFDQWFGLSWANCALFLLFPWSQIYPQSSWLGVGVWGRVIYGSIDWGTTVVNQVIQESLITGFCWLGVALLLSLGMRVKAPQWQILNGLLCFTVLLKSLFSALQFGGEFSLIWLTAGAFWGMAVSTICLHWALRLRQKTKFLLALLCLFGATVLINVMPDNPYFILTLRHWQQGRLLHFNELMQFISVIWLPLAFIWMLRYFRDLQLNR